MQNQIEKLKKFIEITDNELFSHHPTKAYIEPALFIPGDESNSLDAAYVHLPTVSFKNFLLLKRFMALARIAEISFYILSLVRRNPTTKREALRESLQMRYKISNCLKILQRQFYYIKKRSTLKYASDTELLMIAIHEVRHRVQKNAMFSENTSEYDDILIDAYRKSYLIRKMLYTFRGEGYKPHEEDAEMDADFIGLMMVSRFQIEFGRSSTIKEDQLKVFIQKYKTILVWKSPAWK